MQDEVSRRCSPRRVGAPESSPVISDAGIVEGEYFIQLQPYRDELPARCGKQGGTAGDLISLPSLSGTGVLHLFDN